MVIQTAANKNINHKATKPKHSPATPCKIIAWNQKITQLKRKIIFQNSMIDYVPAVNLPGCINHIMSSYKSSSAFGSSGIGIPMARWYPRIPALAATTSTNSPRVPTTRFLSRLDEMAGVKYPP